jgi:hypothetical protein
MRLRLRLRAGHAPASFLEGIVAAVRPAAVDGPRRAVHPDGNGSDCTADTLELWVSRDFARPGGCHRDERPGPAWLAVLALPLLAVTCPGCGALRRPAKDPVDSPREKLRLRHESGYRTGPLASRRAMCSFIAAADASND